MQQVSREEPLAFKIPKDTEWWSDNLSCTVQRVIPIAVTQTSRVYRISAEDGQSYIGKVSGISDRFENEAALDHNVIQHLPIWSPRVLRHGRTLTSDWILYEDLGLKSQPHTNYAYLRAVRTASRFHVQTASYRLPEGVGQSHTPSLETVFAQVIAVDRVDMRASLRDVGAGRHVLDALDSLFEALPAWLPHLFALPHRLCHGDLHYGNLLYARTKRRWGVIDWEFAHMDIDYFDLFQLLDATSPAVQLARPCSRREALGVYINEQRRGGRLLNSSDARRWVIGYLEFAAVYLFWITKLILNDLETGKFTEHMLCRQMSETYRGLESIKRDLHRMRVKL